MDTVIAGLMAFIISVILCPVIIPFLKKLKFGQYIRDEGPKSHQVKSGTPTMGGLVILGSIIITSLLFIQKYPQIVPVLFVTIGFGLIGFLDDYIKVVMKRNLGLLAWQKMLGQFVITAIFLVYIIKYSNLGTETIIPFFGTVTMPVWLYVIMFFFVMLGTVNGANFTDGLDGLATSVTIIIAVFFTAAAYIRGVELPVITAATTGALLGFFLFNKHPAKVFMGDTGSLALGGFVASSAYMLKMPLFIIIVAFIYLAEVLSVIIQVTYFKITHGKRIFKMAPIHHHFELCGFSETQVVAGFAAITAVLCIIAYFGI